LAVHGARDLWRVRVALYYVSMSIDVCIYILIFIFVAPLTSASTRAHAFTYTYIHARTCPRRHHARAPVGGFGLKPRNDHTR